MRWDDDAMRGMPGDDGMDEAGSWMNGLMNGMDGRMNGRRLAGEGRIASRSIFLCAAEFFQLFLFPFSPLLSSPLLSSPLFLGVCMARRVTVKRTLVFDISPPLFRLPGVVCVAKLTWHGMLYTGLEIALVGLVGCASCLVRLGSRSVREGVACFDLGGNVTLHAEG